MYSLDAIDLLQEEDVALVSLFDQLDESRGQGVANQWRHGTLGKQLIRRLGIREATKADIVHAVNDVPEMDSLREQLTGDYKARRSAINALDRLNRHVRAIDLNRSVNAAGEDFDDAVRRLRSVIDTEMKWELGGGIAEFRSRLSTSKRASLHRARYLRSHAPTRLSPKGFRWHERARVVGWILTKWDHSEDRPRPSRASQGN